MSSSKTHHFHTSALKKMFLLTMNTIEKEYRNRSLLFIFALTLLVLFLVNAALNFFSNPLGAETMELSLAARKMSIFYTVISLWSGLLSVIIGVNAVRSDFDSSVASILLSLPIKSIHYLFARVIGSWLIIMGYYLFSITMALFVFGIESGISDILSKILHSYFYTSLGTLFLLLLATFNSLLMPRLFAMMITLAVSGFAITTPTTTSGVELCNSFKKNGMLFFLPFTTLLRALVKSTNSLFKILPDLK